MVAQVDTAVHKIRGFIEKAARGRDDDEPSTRGQMRRGAGHGVVGNADRLRPDDAIGADGVEYDLKLDPKTLRIVHK